MRPVFIKLAKYISGISFLFISLISNPVYAYNCTNWVAKLQSAQGSVQVRQANKQWLQVQRNATFCKGDVLRVQENSRAALLLRNDTLLRLNQNTTITFTNLTPDKPSVVSVTTGFAHFISRVKAAFEVITPFINAAIEGTEFVVAVNKGNAEVTVFEGTVRAYNKHGEARLTSNQTAQAKKGQAPVLILKAKPRDAVNWSLYYPAIIDSDKKSLNTAASQALSVGQVEKATELLNQSIKKNPNNSAALALQAVISIVQNNKEAGLALAQQAVAADNTNVTAKLALSYAQQAHFKVGAALKTLQAATQNSDGTETGNALVWSRLAEVYLMHGELDEALNAAQKANKLNPDLGRTHTVLGFAYLTRIKTQQAIGSFNNAIEKDQTDPLARLGLGLAIIRQGDLGKGRREIEYAATLDPNNALIRSYLGKAYYEEKRNKLAAVQFEMAKTLDPNDPTAYFYDALLNRSEKKPVNAVKNLNHSINLNDNRAIYRSRLSLDQDEAVRNINLAKIYQDLGFEQAALNEATKSLNNNPSNHSAHQFLAGLYGNKPRHEIATVSELFQGRLLQPVSLNPVRPQSTETNLNINSNTHSNLGFNEYSSLFTQNGSHFYSTFSKGSNNTDTSELIVAGLLDNLSFSLGRYSYETDGFRDDANVKHDVTNVSVQSKLSNTLTIQAEYKDRRTTKGDDRQSLDPSFSANQSRTLVDESTQVGLRYQPANEHTILVSHIHNRRIPTLAQQLSATLKTTTNIEDVSNDYQVQYQLNKKTFNLVMGAGDTKIESSKNVKIILNNFITLSNTDSTPIDKQTTSYIYNYFNFGDTELTFGVTNEDIESEKQIHYLNEINPKFGLIYNINDEFRIRLAAFKTIKRALISNQTLEPTQLAGFSQFYDDTNTSKANVKGIALDYLNTDIVSSGLEITKRDIQEPQSSGSPAVLIFQDINEELYSIYLNWLISNNYQLNFQYLKKKFNYPIQEVRDSKLEEFPIFLKYKHQNGFYSEFKYTNIKQKIKFVSSGTSTIVNTDFNVADLSIGYKLPKNSGDLSLSINNLQDRKFKYQDEYEYNADDFNVNTKYIPERTIFLNVALYF